MSCLLQASLIPKPGISHWWWKRLPLWRSVLSVLFLGTLIPDASRASSSFSEDLSDDHPHPKRPDVPRSSRPRMINGSFIFLLFLNDCTNSCHLSNKIYNPDILWPVFGQVHGGGEAGVKCAFSSCWVEIRSICNGANHSLQIIGTFIWCVFGFVGDVLALSIKIKDANEWLFISF